ncbi:MAG: hypothetical protein RBU37_17735 [Myxococcota bacterium]|jgi:hypothetical protein|nr:hypothetical protein [Myxococcota bacterium]
MTTVIIVLVVLVGFGVIAVLQSHLKRKRMEAWQAQAVRMGFGFEGISRLEHEFHGFKLFSQGHGRRSRNVLRGQFQGVTTIVGEYLYTTGSGKNRHRHRQTVFIFENPSYALPHCFLRRESRLFDSLGKLFGGQDINFEEDPEFSKAFVLQGADEDAVRMLFDWELRKGFMAQRGRSLQFEAYGRTLVVHWGIVVSPESIESQLQEAYQLMSLFNDASKRQY